MWLFTQYGFFSAVCARQGDGGHGQPVDSDRIMVRARQRQHLERLIHRFAGHLGGIEMLESTGTDYRYRIFLAKKTWAEVLKQLSLELDYDNFKSAVAKRRDGNAIDDSYEDALHEVWAVMYGIQTSD